MSLNLIKSALTNGQFVFPSQMSVDGWLADETLRAEQVMHRRNYADGDHAATLTTEMRNLLRIGDTSGDSAPFNLNRCDGIVQAVNDRMEVIKITDDDDSEDVNVWIEERLKYCRFDAMQLEVHEAAFRDARTFVFVNWDAENGEVEFIHEPAYDGVSGLLVLYERRNRSEIRAAIKVWHVTSESGNLADTMRVNVYYPDRIEKYISRAGALRLEPYYDEDDPATLGEDKDGKQFVKWTMPDETPIGVPIVAFVNRAQPYTNDGRSELDDIIPVQDAINRLMYSMVLAAELTGFQNRVAIGFQPPPGLTPGAWIVVAGDSPPDKDSKLDVKVLESGTIDPYIAGLNFLIQQADQISRTPNPETMGSSDSSGEALKQREIGLLGKVKRAQISFGNSWEDVIALAARVQSAFGEVAPVFEQLKAEWRDAEVRNQAAQIESIVALAKIMGQKWAQRQIGKLFDMTEAEIQTVQDEQEQEAEQARTQMMEIAMRSNPGRSGDRNGNPNGQKPPIQEAA